MALFGSKKNAEKALEAAKTEVEQKMKGEVDAAVSELKKLKAEKSSLEEELNKKITGLQEEVQKRDKTLEELSAKHEEELQKIHVANSEEISRIRKESVIQTQQMMEFIDNRKDELRNKSEKELLVSAMMALDGYAGRLERMEKNMEFRELKERISDMKNEFSEALDKSETVLLEKLEGKEIFEKIDQLQKTTTDKLDGMQNDISSQIDNDTDILIGKIESMKSTLTKLMDSLKLPQKLEELSKQIDGLYVKLSDKVEELEEEISEKLDNYDLASSVESLRETVNGMDSTVDDISSSTEKIVDWLNESGLLYDSYNLRNELRAFDDLKSEIRSLESLRDDISEIKNEVCYSINSDNVSSKLDSIESSIHSLEFSVEAAKDAAERAADHSSF